MATNIMTTVTALSSGLPGSRDAVFDWTFTSASGDPRSGQYENGDWWVAPSDGDTKVTLTALVGSGNVGETDLLSMSADPITESHGLLDGSKSYGTYDSNKNELSSLPREYATSPASCMSLVAAMQRNESETTNGGTSAIVGENTDAYCIVTVLPEPPPTDSLRPNFTGETREFLTWADFDLTRLPSSDLFSSLTAGEIEEIRLRWSAHTEVFGFGYYEDSEVKWASEGGRAFRAQCVVNNYASGTMQQLTEDFLRLCNSSNTLADKKPALAAILSYALDIYHTRYDYGSDLPKCWTSGAGQHAGHFLPVVILAALETDDSKANELKQVVADSFSDDITKRGPQVLRQWRRGQSGVHLWGDNHATIRSDTTSITEDDRRYWNDFQTGGHYLGSTITPIEPATKRTSADPYGYVDGAGEYPGYGYLPISAGNAKNLAAVMLLFPEAREIVNTDQPIEVADRVTRFGTWASPDIVKPPTVVDQDTEACDPWTGGAGCTDYRTLWGPTSADVRLAVTDGIGRFDPDDYHGQPVSISYTANSVISNWDTIIATHSGDLYDDTEVSLDTCVKPDIFNVNNTIYMESGTHFSEIRYTTDGSDPTESSLLYSAPFVISEGLTVKAMTVKSGMSNSDISVINEPVTPPSNMTNPPNTQATQAALDSIKSDCDTLNALGVGTSTITASDLSSQDYEAAFATQKANQDNLNTDNSLGLTLTALPGTFEGNMTALYNNLVAIEAALS